MAYRVLVVEDDAAIVLFLSDVLRRQGYVIAGIAATGKDAIRLANLEMPDVILMDVSLAGGMTGIQAATQIRQHLDLPIIFATAHSDEATLRGVQANEPYGFVLKPYDLNDLRVAIEIAIHKHRVDQNLRRSEQRFSMTLKAIADAVVSTRQTGAIDFYNDSAAKLTGVPAQNAIGKSVTTVVTLLDSITDELLSMGKSWNGAATLVDAQKQRIPVSASIANIASDGGPTLGQVLVLRDVREQQRIADFQESQRVQRIIEEVSESERRRIGQDLHDGLGQMLTGAAFLCTRLEEQLTTPSPDGAKQAARIGTILGEAIESARDLSHGLLPVPEGPGGLAIALERLAEQVTSRCGIECDFVDASANLISSPAVANHLFRICQEAVNNAVKHANSKRIDIHLRTDRDSGTLTISDDGSGIIQNPKRRGSGLDIMRQRATTIGGALKIVNRAGAGSTVSCSFSMEPQ